MRSDRWPDGELVTLLVGVGLELAELHRAGRSHGALHPVHIECDSSGRPRLRPMGRSAGDGPQGDVLALLRLGAALGGEGSRVAAACRTDLYERRQAVCHRSLQEVVSWLLTLAAARPLERLRSWDR